MLDAFIRPYIDPPLNKMGKYLALRGISPNSVTLVGFGFGVVAIYFIAHHLYLIGLVMIVLNRVFDGLDGALARETGLTDLGGFLDIVCDFIIYSGVIFGFALAQPHHALWAAFLIFSYVGPASSFLAYAIFAERHKMRSDERGKKSLYYLGGLCEGTETFIVMVLLCLYPQTLPYVCAIYGAMCWITCVGRAYTAYRDFAPR